MTVDEFKALLVSMGVDEQLITPEAVREEVELDSLGVAELAHVLNREKGIPVTEEELHGAVTVRDVVDVISGAAGSAAGGAAGSVAGGAAGGTVAGSSVASGPAEGLAP